MRKRRQTPPPGSAPALLDFLDDPEFPECMFGRVVRVENSRVKVRGLDASRRYLEWVDIDTNRRSRILLDTLNARLRPARPSRPKPPPTPPGGRVSRTPAAIANPPAGKVSTAQVLGHAWDAPPLERAVFVHSKDQWIGPRKQRRETALGRPPLDSGEDEHDRLP
jgi:hypothetical protein